LAARWRAGKTRLRRQDWPRARSAGWGGRQTPFPGRIGHARVRIHWLSNLPRLARKIGHAIRRPGAACPRCRAWRGISDSHVSRARRWPILPPPGLITAAPDRAAPEYLAGQFPTRAAGSRQGTSARGEPPTSGPGMPPLPGPGGEASAGQIPRGSVQAGPRHARLGALYSLQGEAES
jgi:hypothetical protein